MAPRQSMYLLICTLIASCVSNPPPVELSPGVYMIFREDQAGIFGNQATFRARVIQEASKFASTKGAKAVPVSSRFTPRPPAMGFASFEYQFRLVPLDDSTADGTSLMPAPDITIKSETIERPASSRATSSTSKDSYQKLQELHELRKKGVLSEKEFLDQKAKVLKNY